MNPDEEYELDSEGNPIPASATPGIARGAELYQQKHNPEAKQKQPSARVAALIKRHPFPRH